MKGRLLGADVGKDRGGGQHDARVPVEVARLAELSRSFEFYVADYRRLISDVMILAVSHWSSRKARRAEEFAEMILAFDAKGLIGDERKEGEAKLIGRLQRFAGRYLNTPAQRTDSGNARDADIPTYRELDAVRTRLGSDAPNMSRNEVAIDIYFHSQPSLDALLGAMTSVASLLDALGASSVRAAYSHSGSRFERIIATVKGAIHRKEFREGARSIVRDIYDSLTTKSGDKERAVAEGTLARAEADLRQLEAKLKKNPSQQALEAMKLKAEVSEKIFRARIARIEELAARQKLIDSTSGAVRDLLSREQAFALAITADGTFGIVRIGDELVWEEDGAIETAPVENADSQDKALQVPPQAPTIPKDGDGDASSTATAV